MKIGYDNGVTVSIDCIAVEKRIPRNMYEYFGESWLIKGLPRNIYSKAKNEADEAYYSDYFGSISIGQKAKDQILRDWRHNPENFRMLKKQNQLVYDAGEHGYDADNLIKILPEVLEATRSGTKVVMLLDKAEEFFGVKFKRRLFNR